MLFGNDRDALRRRYIEAWRKHQAGTPMEPLELQLAAVIERHPEYHALLTDEERALTHEPSPESGESNAFLHMGMHLALWEQVQTNRPAGIANLHAAAVARSGDPHAVDHRFMECLGRVLWEAQRSGRPPDEQAYLACLRGL